MAVYYKRPVVQVGTSDYFRDIAVKAKKPGKRISKTGRVYYEYRANRSDIDPKVNL